MYQTALDISAVPNGRKTKAVRAAGKSAKKNLSNSFSCRRNSKTFRYSTAERKKVNPKLTAYQVELAQVESEIEKLLFDTLTGANATLLAYANKKLKNWTTDARPFQRQSLKYE